MRSDDIRRTEPVRGKPASRSLGTVPPQGVLSRLESDTFDLSRVLHQRQLGEVDRCEAARRREVSDNKDAFEHLCCLNVPLSPAPPVSFPAKRALSRKHVAPGASVAVQVSSPSGGSAGKLMLAGEGGVRLPFGQVRVPAELGPGFLDRRSCTSRRGRWAPSVSRPCGSESTSPFGGGDHCESATGCHPIAQPDTSGGTPKRQLFSSS